MFQFAGLAPRQSVVPGLQPGGLPHSETRGYNGYLHLPAAYRSLSRPSSPMRAKAFTVRPYLLSLNILQIKKSISSNMSKNLSSSLPAIS
jgi:hypothetical protein